MKQKTCRLQALVFKIKFSRFKVTLSDCCKFPNAYSQLLSLSFRQGTECLRTGTPSFKPGVASLSSCVSSLPSPSLLLFEVFPDATVKHSTKDQFEFLSSLFCQLKIKWAKLRFTERLLCSDTVPNTFWVSSFNAFINHLRQMLFSAFH